MPTPDVNMPDEYKIRVLEAPTNYTVTTDAGLEDIHVKEVRIQEIPKIVLEADSSLSSTSNSEVTVRSENNLRIKEIPEIRAHVPMNFNFGVKFFGLEFLVFSLCGELQLITEKYVPHRSERCEDPYEDPVTDA